ncbi:MAG: hypothetical protein NPMRTHETA2_2270002 [Nitrosopumilales archaeon]|nr:MAG: hypothetical protein NPMRTHETA2_2270002 [Nitrosopumilales archaeon]
MALDGKTPAEKCGIKIEGKNKWLTLIQNYPLPTEIFTLKLKDKKKGFPLELSSIEVNVGIVKAKFNKKK